MPKPSNMKAFLSKSWGGSEVPYAPVESTPAATGTAAAIKPTSTKGVTVVVLLLLALVVAISVSWINGANFGILTSWSEEAVKTTTHSHKPKLQPKPITLKCPTANHTAAPLCSSRIVSPSPSPSPTYTSAQASCPEYFRWIHEDLRPWRSTGITREMVESSRKLAAFRLVVLDGRVYVDTYHGVFQTRDTFTLWGILQLVSRYPGRVPDLDLMFNCDDMPTVMAAGYTKLSPPPPLFRYCKNDASVDIVFPDWSFWGWPEVDIKPWGTMLKEMEEGNEKTKWKDRQPYAYWKGNQLVSGGRQDLMKCDISSGHEWNARLYSQDWVSERRQGFNDSNLANQCHHRYKIYVEGRSWSVSEKYILACDSPALYVTTHFHDFFSRGLMPGRHYWPINEHHKCTSIKFAVDWGNAHQREAQALGKAGSSFAREALKMDLVYDYMLHLLTEYAKLLRYKPTVPEKATEFCLESMACPKQGGVGGLVGTFMAESMERWTHDEEPCALPPPYTPEELRELAAEKAAHVKLVQGWEEKANTAGN